MAVYLLSIYYKICKVQ